MTEQNVDPQEIEKFAALAARWWDPNSEFRPLHQINPLRLNYIQQKTGGLKGKRILDVGCGGGILSESMAVAGGKVTGIDMGEAQISVAKLHALESEVDVDYRLIDTELLAQQEAGQYDIVTCLEMLEHVPEPGRIVEACSKLVKPGGSVFFSTINRNPKAWLMAIVGAEYILKLLPKGTHEYQKLIKPSELHAWCRTSDLEVNDMIGLHYNPITSHYKLGPGVDVNYMLWTQRDSE